MTDNTNIDMNRAVTELSKVTSLVSQATNANKKGKIKRHEKLTLEALKSAERLSELIKAAEPSVRDKICESIHKARVIALHSLGLHYHMENNLVESKRCVALAREICVENFGKVCERYLSLSDSLAKICLHLEEHSETEAVCREAIAIGERLLGRESLTVAEFLSLLAKACRAQGKELLAIGAEQESANIQLNIYEAVYPE